MIEIGTKWDKKIKLVLSLRELQLIYDMAIDGIYKTIIETDYYEKNEIPYNVIFFKELEYNVKKILDNNGGFTI